MKYTRSMFLITGVILLTAFVKVKPGEKYVLASSSLQLSWIKKGEGWSLSDLRVKRGTGWLKLGAPDGEYTLLYSADKPNTTLAQPIIDQAGNKVEFPERIYKYNLPNWNEATTEVELNTAGEAINFYPESARKSADGRIRFNAINKVSDLEAIWSIDRENPTDILVELKLTAKADGYYSLASPSITSIASNQLSWGMIPGYFQGAAIEKDFVKAFAYGQGIPDRPVVVRERTATTLSPIITAKNGLTIGVIPAPGQGRNPWTADKFSHSDWQIGLSLMNRKSALVPTAYHPVLGQKGSYLKVGETVSFSFRYSIMDADWYAVYKHVVKDIYKFEDFLALKQTSQSLTDRLFAMHKYLSDDKTSKWRTEEFNGLTLGAQAYEGGIYGSDKDAMKNSDYGAMWMVANIMNDTVLKENRLPYARNFKLEQQQVTPGFFQGAVIGQYYLSKSKKFVEEWGNYVEPIGLSYYNLMDIGNILLFDPTDVLLKSRFKSGAEKLLKWQYPNGQWEVAYDKSTGKKLFPELQDLRPTFYGMLVAYKILNDERYLDAACKGADWYIRNAVDKGHFLGVCGDNRFVPDFATVQSAQALLDLYDTTKKPKYKAAAIKAARFYTTSIYTHPIPSRQERVVNGVNRQDWEISQVGLSFEHGGTTGSANTDGPILLASHAGLFIRLYQLTNDALFLTMARAATLGRDAFVDPKTSVASYYWKAMDKGPGAFPHHAWWQIGWITDYLMSEIALRSKGEVTFPRGFITPKVGPHQSYGFAPGLIYGRKVHLKLSDGMLITHNPYLDYMAAVDESNDKIYYILLNNNDEVLKTKISLSTDKVVKNAKISNVSWLTSAGTSGSNSNSGDDLDVVISPYGMKVIEAGLTKIK